MKRIIMVLIIITAFGTVTWAQMGGMMGEGMHDISPIKYPPDMFTKEMHISRGGQLYDNWWKTTVNTPKPEVNHPYGRLKPLISVTDIPHGVVRNVMVGTTVVKMGHTARVHILQALRGCCNRPGRCLLKSLRLF